MAKVRCMTIGKKARTAKAAMAAIMLAAVPMQAWADVAQTFYERSFVLAANQRCGLFTAPVRSALTAAQRQARGAALRAGTAATALNETEMRARARAGTVACDNADLRVVKNRVEAAFAGWQRMPRMTFPGLRADWVANRVVYRSPNWRLMQASVTGASPVTFGYASSLSGESLAAVVSFHGRPRPYAVRIVMRDPGKSPRAWLGAAGQLPPAALQQVIWSSGVTAADAGLLSAGKTEGQAWRFPASAAAALDRLDPREPFAIEFVFRDDSVARAVFEVGDFSAGRAFLELGAL